jgi:lipopolysaccharide/colanic/teichoic acid biosynthesis glycosyltransferase
MHEFDFQRTIKRIIDFCGSMLLIVLLSPLFLSIVVAIYLFEGSPILHRRKVLGQHGEFDAFKFRSMIRNADAALASNTKLNESFVQQFKLKSDPRVTRLGKWLRKFSLDELPQLFNILKGQMSLVGPRMITREELPRYSPYEPLLLKVKPGLTGLWQVKGRQEVSYDERVKMDIYYINNWSLLFDLKILLLTPSKVIRTEGAY